VRFVACEEKVSSIIHDSNEFSLRSLVTSYVMEEDRRGKAQSARKRQKATHQSQRTGEEEDDEDYDKYEEEEEEEDSSNLSIRMDIWRKLDKLKRPGTFCSRGKMEFTAYPGLVIKDHPNIGMLSLPLREDQAKELAKICFSSPYGKKEKTIYDKSVRNTWQLNPSQLTFANQANWDEAIKRFVMPTVKLQLGCPDRMNVTYELYKLLLYEEGLLPKQLYFSLLFLFLLFLVYFVLIFQFFRSSLVFPVFFVLPILFAILFPALFSLLSSHSSFVLFRSLFLSLFSAPLLLLHNNRWLLQAPQRHREGRRNVRDVGHHVAFRFYGRRVDCQSQREGESL